MQMRRVTASRVEMDVDPGATGPYDSLQFGRDRVSGRGERHALFVLWGQPR
jgi:hypothetical protein